MWVKSFLTIGSILSVLGVAWGGAWLADDRFSKREELQKVSTNVQLIGSRLEQKIQADRINGLDERLWRLKLKYGQDCHLTHEVCKNVKRDLDNVVRQFEILGKEKRR